MWILSLILTESELVWSRKDVVNCWWYHLWSVWNLIEFWKREYCKSFRVLLVQGQCSQYKVSTDFSHNLAAKTLQLNFLFSPEMSIYRYANCVKELTCITINLSFWNWPKFLPFGLKINVKKITNKIEDNSSETSPVSRHLR